MEEREEEDERMHEGKKKAEERQAEWGHGGAYGRGRRYGGVMEWSPVLIPKVTTMINTA